MLTYTVKNETRQITLNEAIEKVKSASAIKLDIDKFLWALPRGYWAYLSPGDNIIIWNGTGRQFKKLVKRESDNAQISN